MSLSKSQIAGAVVGSFLACVVVGSVVTASLILWVSLTKRMKHRPGRSVQLPQRLFSSRQVVGRPDLHESGGHVQKFKYFDFPRDNVEILNILGTCSTSFHS